MTDWIWQNQSKCEHVLFIKENQGLKKSFVLGNCDYPWTQISKCCSSLSVPRKLETQSIFKCFFKIMILVLLCFDVQFSNKFEIFESLKCRI